MTDLTLNDGRTIPAIGFGTYKVPAEDSARLSREAIDAGYRLIDTAAFYGNEAGVGEAAGDSDVFVTTKLPPDRAGRARETLEQSLGGLGVDRVDLWLIHWPPSGDPGDDQPSKLASKFCQLWWNWPSLPRANMTRWPVRVLTASTLPSMHSTVRTSR